MRIKTAIILGFILICAALPRAARAQYQPIPNYIGIGAGLQFRNDINNHLSGVTPIAPRLVRLPFAQLPTEQDGQLYWCADCHETAPCTAGGAGAPAVGVDGQWSCSAAAAPASAFPLTGNVSASGYRIANLAPNATAGDALSQSQSHLNDLAAATGVYSMGGNKLQSVAGGATSGDALAYGQSGAVLDGLNLDNGALTNIGAGNASGQVLAWGQNNAQLTVNQASATLVSQANSTPGAGTSATVTPSAVFANGDVIITYESTIGATAETVTAPAGFTQLFQEAETAGPGAVQTIFCKVASSEPTSYSWSWTNAGAESVVLMENWSGLAGCAPDAINGGNVNGSATLTLPTITPTHVNDLILVSGAQDNEPGNTASSAGALVYDTGNSQNFYQFTQPLAPLPVLTLTGNNTGPLAGIAAAFPTGVTIQSPPLLMNQEGAHLQTLDATVNRVINVMAAPYNARGDGATDDYGAIQQAIYDACLGMPPTFPSNRGGKAAIYLPATLGGYAISKPLRLLCDHLTFYGAGPGSKIDKGFVGPSIIAEGWQANNLTYGAPLVGSTGNSLVYNSGNYIDAARALNTRNINFANDSANGFDIEFWAEVPSISGELTLLSSIAPPSPGPASSMFVIRQGFGNGQLVASVNTTGGTVSLTSSCADEAANTPYDIALDWDKSTYRLFQNGVLCASAASTNPPIMGPTEAIPMPDNCGNQVYPDQGGTQCSGSASLDSVRFERTSLHTAAYTPPTAKFVADSNTDLLINFNADVDSTQVGYHGTSSGIDNVYLPVLGGGDGSPASTNLNVHDLELCGPSMIGRYGQGDGLFANWAVSSQWKNLSCGSGTFVAFDFYGSDFNSIIEGLSSFGGMVNYDFGNAFNSSKALNNYADNATFECVQESGNEFFEDYTECVDRGGLRYYEYVGAAFGGGTIKDFYVDAEAANTGFVAGIVVKQGGLPVTMVHVEPNTRNSSPFIVLDPTVPLTLIDPAFDPYGAATPAADLVQFTSAPTAGDTPVTIIGGQPFPTGTPISNYPAFVQVLGSNNVLGSLQLQNAPTLDAGLNHAVVNAIPDPAAPTIVVQGTAGTSNYGPYFTVCHDANGGVTNVSPASSTLANGPAALSASDYIQITWAAESGCASWDVLKGTTGTALATGLPGSATSVNDTGQTTTSYVPPARNTTGDVAYGSILVSVGMPYAKIPTTVVNGGRFYCTDCDPPANPPASCTHIGAKTGSWVDGLNNQWLCVP